MLIDPSKMMADLTAWRPVPPLWPRDLTSESPDQSEGPAPLLSLRALVETASVGAGGAKATVPSTICPPGQSSGPVSPDEAASPVVWRGHVYWLAGKKARDLFSANPLKYTAAQVETPPLQMPVRVAIVGPPKSGKTTRRHLRPFYACRYEE
ncbi:unnamed protein product [Protopolystoma xenopodis]|uniref:Uncharacterized protein n=1 Tax=Protopolystoma xenopodis TaxID=117903 RepID=A0A3S5AJ34_9PLAT|nr:unnamed protein product [Protopolystoma xenopodis]